MKGVETPSKGPSRICARVCARGHRGPYAPDAMGGRFSRAPLVAVAMPLCFCVFSCRRLRIKFEAKVADPLSSLRRGREGGRGGLHRLNAQGGSQGLPPWRSFLTARVSPGGLFDHQGSREGTSSLGLGFIFLQIKRVFRRDPPPF